MKAHTVTSGPFEKLPLANTTGNTWHVWTDVVECTCACVPYTYMGSVFFSKGSLFYMRVMFKSVCIPSR